MTVQTPTDPKPAAPARSKGALAVAIGTIIVGGCVILGTLVSTGISAAYDLRGSEAGPPLQQSDVQGVRDLDVDLAGGALSISYDDVSDAELSGGGAGAWTLERRGNTLHVSSPRRSFADWGSGSQATLTLPQSLERADLDLRVEVAGGTLDLTGDYGNVDVQVTGGAATLSGGASALTLSVSGGSITADVDGADAATFEVTGGDLTADLTGAAPARTSVEVTAGSADIGLPDETYRLTSDGPGSVDNSLRTSPTATPRVDVQATIGSVTLRTS
jgi:hypothetical protein